MMVDSMPFNLGFHAKFVWNLLSMLFHLAKVLWKRFSILSKIYSTHCVASYVQLRSWFGSCKAFYLMKLVLSLPPRQGIGLFRGLKHVVYLGFVLNPVIQDVERPEFHDGLRPKRSLAPDQPSICTNTQELKS